MNNRIIRVGIDLGTTNSAIAINDGAKIKIIENNSGDLYIPSVFGFDKRNNPVVGTFAYDQLFKFSRDEDYKNYIAEIKRLMGTNDKVYFPRVDESKNPEEISAEILKELKSEMTKKYNDISQLGVVITVPAFFDTVQSEATKRSGRLAGFDHVVLVQEPIAAAMAYGFGNSNDENWLVYDLGGGTFDVALISSMNKNLRVVDHGGDNHLGGKDIDELIVQKIIVPEILKKYEIKDFNSKNDKYKSHFLRLKKIAESAKIKLSSQDEVYLDSDEVNFNLIDDKGNEVFFSFPFNVREFNNLITPIINKTIDKVEEVIIRSKMKMEEINRIIFVGATTKIPYIKERIERKFKIDVDVSKNPFTIVAEGAAIFALSQQIPKDILLENENIKPETIKLDLNYNSMTNEDYELVTGTLSLDKSENYHFIVNSKNGFFNSERISIENNSFYFMVSLEENKNNEYWIYLIDDMGNSIDVYPNNFSILQGMYVSGVPIPHTIGVIYHKQDKSGEWVETCDPYFNKNSILPLKETKTFKTINRLNKGTDEILPIIVYEGDNITPSLNQEITRIGIDGKKLPFNLEKGEEIDITISINDSRELEVEVYIPVLDVALNARVDVHSHSIDSKELIKEIKEVEKDIIKLDTLISKDSSEELKEKAKEIKTRIETTDDTDSKQLIEREIREIKTQINTINESSKFDRLREEYDKGIQKITDMLENVIEKDKKDNFQKDLSNLKNKADKIITSRNEDMMDSLLKEVDYLENEVRRQDPTFWIGMFYYITQTVSTFTNNAEAERLKNEVANNAKKGDLDSLRHNVLSLLNLIPKEESHKVEKVMSGITK